MFILCVHLCVWVCVCAHHYSAHWAGCNKCWVKVSEWTKKSTIPPTFCLAIGPRNSFPLYNWLPISAPPIPLVLLELLPGYIRSSYIWAELWMFTAALLQSECRLRQPHTLTHTPVQRKPQNAPRWYPDSAARPAGTDADTSKCSTGITFPLDTRPTHPIHKEKKSEGRRDCEFRHSTSPEQLDTAPAGDVSSG